MKTKLQKLAKQMDYLERAKREEAAPLTEAAFQQCLVEEQIMHAREQQLEVERSRQGHDHDLQEKNRLARMLTNKENFQERITRRREAEYAKQRQEREERIKQIILERKQERELKRKMIFHLDTKEERLNKLKQEEEARKREEKERKKKEEAERQAKLDEIAAKQRQKELEIEEKKRREKEQILGGGVLPPARTSEPLSRPRPRWSPLGRYVPRHLRGKVEASTSPRAAPTQAHAHAPEADKWGRKDDRPVGDKWRSDRSGHSERRGGDGGTVVLAQHPSHMVVVPS